jgi:hypothetical protein
MTAAGDPWLSVTAARLPAAGLARLAAVRHLAGVAVQLDGETAWVHWPAGRVEVVRCLMPVAGVQFYRASGGEWFRFDSRLPSSEQPPSSEKKSIANVIVPDRTDPRPPTDTPLSPVGLGVARGGPPRPATALLCAVRDLAGWADAATTRELAGVSAALHADRALLLGDRLPFAPAGTRFWGETVLAPVGFRPDPPLPPAVIRDAVGAAADELVFMTEAAVEIVPRAAFAPLTRPKLRLALAPGPLP